MPRTPSRPPSHGVRALMAIALVTIVLVAAALLLAPEKEISTVRVAVTSHPLLDIVRSVAGPTLATSSLLPPGQDPHSFEPSPSTVAMLSTVDVVYAIGHGFDDWADIAIRETDAVKVVVDANIALRDASTPIHDEDAEEHAEEEDGHGPVDPHYWLDGRNAIQIAKTVAADLSQRFPGEAARIDENLSLTIARIARADDEARALLADIPSRSVVTLHDAWYYFAEAYDLDIVGSFEPTAAREPSPQYLAALEDAVRASGTSTLYTEIGGTTSAVRSFAADNGLDVAELDPLEGATIEPYDVILLRNAQTIRDHQR